ncbi:MAG: LicD family protein [Lachnospiraceae bacterium]|nr:LicD family protein [Lachnospiraceae bacterium]
MNREVSDVLLGLLIKLDEVCERHHLRYYIAYGTCLGSLRHGGFIPWDHDIDVLMPIEHAKKLVEYQDEFGEDYFLQCKKTDPEYDSISYKLRDSSTACMWPTQRGVGFNQGISVDIYPFYNCPPTRAGLLLNIWRSYFYRILVAGRLPVNHSRFMKMLSRIVLGIYRGERREKKAAALEKKLSSVKKGREILDYYGEDISFFSAITYPRAWFGKPRKMEFEGMLFNGPTEPEKYMKRRYGDYMTLPPEEKRVNALETPGLILDPNRSYREYVKEMEG